MPAVIFHRQPIEAMVSTVAATPISTLKPVSCWGFALSMSDAAKIKALKDDIATLGVSRAVGEIRIKDRLLVSEERTLASTFYPRAPATEIKASVLNVEDGVRNAGALDVVAINRGERDGLQAGDTLAISKRGDITKDRVANQRVQLPDERIGLLMVFYTYEKMSFGLVMEADRQVDIGDLLGNP